MLSYKNNKLTMHLAAHQRGWILFTIMLIVMLTNIDFTAVAVALPGMTADFNAGLDLVQWVNGGFAILSAVCMIPAGRIGDSYGQWRAMNIGVAIFLLSCLAAAIAKTTWLLILSRMGQGVGIAFAGPTGMAIIAANFTAADERGYAIGMLSAMIGIAQSLGPTIGGFLVHLFSWRAVFFINVPICLLILLLSQSLKHPTTTTGGRFDYIGFVLQAAAVIMLLTALNMLETIGAHSVVFYAMIITGMILLVLFFMSQRYIKNPLIQLELFKNPIFAVINIARVGLIFGFMLILTFIPLYLENIAGLSVIHTSLQMLGMTIIFGVLSPSAGRSVDRFGIRNPIVTGFIILSLGLYLIGFVEPLTSTTYLTIALACVGAGLGCLFPITMTVGTLAVPLDQTGVGTGIILTTTFIGAAFAVALAGAVLENQSAWMLTQGIAANGIQLPSQFHTMIYNAATGANSIADLSTHLPSDLYQQLVPLLQTAHVYALNIIFKMASAIALSTSLLCAFTLRYEWLCNKEKTHAT